VKPKKTAKQEEITCLYWNQ